MQRIYFTSDGRIAAGDFRRYFMASSLFGAALAYIASILLFNTFSLPFVPFMPNPDPLHQGLYLLFPMAVSAPLFIKRQHDRNRSPMFFTLFAGMTIGLALFGAAGSTATHPITQAELEAFVARNAVHAPVTLMGLWLIVECCFLKGERGPNRYGPPADDKAAHKA